MKQQTQLLITMTPEDGMETTLTYYSCSATAIIKLNKDLLASDTYSFFLYNDENMFLDNAETGGDNLKRRGRTLKMVFSAVPVWIPGRYFLLMRNSNYQIFRFDITLDDHGTFTASAPQQCTRLSMEDLLSSRLVIQKQMWKWLSSRPGMRQFKQKALERVQLAEMNHLRSLLTTVGDIGASSNYLVSTRGYSMIHQSLLLFRGVTKMGRNFEWVDCSEIYNPARTNPCEGISEAFEDKTTPSNILETIVPIGTPQVFCLEHISSLLDTGGKYIVKEMRKHSNFIFIGTQAEIDNVLEQYPSFRELFPKENHISVEPFTLKEIIFWFLQRTECHNIPLSAEATDLACKMLAKAFEQGVIAKWTLDDIDRYVKEYVKPRYCERLAAVIKGGVMTHHDIEVQPVDMDFGPLFEKDTTTDSTLDELNAMVGLDNIKKSLTTIANNMRMFSEREHLGLHTSSTPSYHAIFMGNPGTGKTTVARMLGKIYHSLGLLSRGDVVCVDRSRIIGRFLGETEDNMKQILEEARGNVLFVDEAYTLYCTPDSNDFGRRAVDCLLPVLTQKNPDMLIVFAGYREEMDLLMSMNPGLIGRFPYKFLFEDYSADELMMIACSLLAKDDYVLTDDAAVLLRRAIVEAKGENSKNFANARWVEQFVGNGIIPAMANRLASTPHAFTRETYQRVEASDVQRASIQFNPRTIELKPRRKVGFSA